MSLERSLVLFQQVQKYTFVHEVNREIIIDLLDFGGRLIMIKYQMIIKKIIKNGQGIQKGDHFKNGMVIIGQL